MGLFNNVSGSWKTVNSIFVNVAGVWKTVTKGFVNVAGTWRQFFPGSITIENTVSITKSTDGTTFLVTLTGRNYHWSPAPATLTYYFDWSTNNITWTQMSTGTATNPATGSSNTYTYEIPTGYFSANTLNYYRFRVHAASGSATGDSSDSTTIQGPTDITDLASGTTTQTSVYLSWTASTGANRYMVYTSTDNSTFTQYTGTSLTSVTVSSLSADTTYYFKIKPITGSTNNTGYSGNYSNTVTKKTDAYAIPVKTSSPTLSGTAKAFTSLTGTSGVYQSGTYTSKTTYIGVTTSSTAPTDGLTSSSLGAKSGNPYKVTQTDASGSPYYFYTVDAVLGLDGTTTYYYYSAGIKSGVGNITDTYTRTISTGSDIGVMTPDMDSAMTPKSYTYNSDKTSSNWAVSGSALTNSTNPAVGATNPAAYPYQTVNLADKVNSTISVKSSGNPGGIGVIFWSSAAGSWYAAAPFYYTSTSATLVYTCNVTGSSGLASCTPAATASSGAICSCASTVVTSYACNQSGGSNTSGCPTLGTGAGANCNCTSSSSTSYSCDGATQGPFTGNCPTASNAQGGVCNCQQTHIYSYACDQSGSSNTTGCPTLGTGPGDPCGCTSSTTTNYGSCHTPRDSDPAGCISTGCGTGLVKCPTGTTTTYSWSTRSSTDSGYNQYTYQTRQTAIVTTTYSWNTRTTTPTNTTTYTSTLYDAGTYPTLYNTNLRIYSASGSPAAVSVISDENKDSNAISYTQSAGIKVATSGDVITATLYSDSALSTAIGTATSYTATGAIKTRADGSTSAGVIKTGSTALQGSGWDDLSIT